MGGDNEEIVVEVDVEAVDNVVPIVDLLPRIARGMAREAERAQADPGVSEAVERRLRAATRLAEQLTQEVRRVQAIAPENRLFAGRVRPDGPGRPDRPGRPGRPPQG